MTFKNSYRPISFGGSFDFESMICILFQNDLSPFPTQKGGSELLDRACFDDIAKSAFKGRDVVPLRNLKKLKREELESIKASLFHERTHYWQFISSPLLQHHFILSLEQLRFELSQLGGMVHHICSIHPGRTESKEDLDLNLASINSHFNLVDVTPDMIIESDLISRDPLMEVLFLFLPHEGSENTVLEGYGAHLGFGGSEKTAVFPFNGRYLLESASWVSEHLFSGVELPKVKHLDTKQDQVYCGAWEFWRRLHGPRYASEEDLAFSFLAAVDLTLASDVFESHGAHISGNEEYRLQMSNIPYRFGTIAYKALEAKPLKSENDELATCVTEFQHEICSLSNWPTPEESLRKMAAYLTTMLVQASGGSILKYDEKEDVIEDMILPIMNKPYEEIADRFERLEEIWNLLEKIGSAKEYLLGKYVVATMLNACLFRIHNPGKFGVMHRYVSDLTSQFPLPILLINDVYYQGGGAFDFGWPFPITGTHLLHDCIGLMTVAPLKRGINSCGFKEKLTDCFYTRSGLGCPMEGLTTEQFALRASYRVGDWCHRTVRTRWLSIAPSQIQKHREATMNSTGELDISRKLMVELCRSKEYDDAVREFETLVSIQPEWSQYHYEAICSLFNVFIDGRKVRKAFEDLAKRAKTNAILWYGLGMVCQANSSIAEAITAYQAGLRADSLFAPLHYNLGIAYQANGQMRKAITCYEEAAVLSPRFAEPHFGLASIYFNQGKLREALNHFHSFVDLAKPYHSRYMSEAQLMIDRIEVLISQK